MVGKGNEDHSVREGEFVEGLPPDMVAGIGEAVDVEGAKAKPPAVPDRR